MAQSQHGIKVYVEKENRNTMDSEIRYKVRESFQLLGYSEYSLENEEQNRQDNFSVRVSENKIVCTCNNSSNTPTYKFLELQDSSCSQLKLGMPSQTNQAQSQLETSSLTGQFPAGCIDPSANCSRPPAVSNVRLQNVPDSNTSMNSRQKLTACDNLPETLSRKQCNNDPNLTQYFAYNTWQTVELSNNSTAYSQVYYNNNSPFYSSIPVAKQSEHSFHKMLNETRDSDQETHENDSPQDEHQIDEEHEEYERDDCASSSNVSVKSEPVSPPVSPQSFLHIEHVCRWQDVDVTKGKRKVCCDSFDTMYDLVEHITMEHVTTDTDKLFFVCNWENCERKLQPFKARYKLINHIRLVKYAGHYFAEEIMH